MTVAGSGRLRGAVGLLGVAAILFGVSGAVAEDSDTQQTPRTARLSLVEGHVQLSQGGQPVADAAPVNTPLFEGAQISSTDDARAEIQFEDGSVVRVPPASSIALTVLRPGETEVTLNNGIGYFELQDGGNGSFKVKFDDIVATASGFTVMRVKMDNPPGSVAVFSGNAHLEGQGTQADVRGGESVTLGSAGGQFSVAENIEPDSWDAWNSDRDQALTASESAAAPDENAPQRNNPAWGDLNTNGSWYKLPDQGYVWSPYEASNPGWDPWGEGYWVWTPRFGYMWVSSYSWGYMPYQCGYWNWYDMFGWGWMPGPCNTWWAGGGGYTGWDFNVQNPPRWYRLPVRPGPPHPRNPDPKHIVRAVGPQPIIPVLRDPQRGGPRTLPPRDHVTAVVLGGRPVPPLHPVTRPVYRPQPVGSGSGITVHGMEPSDGARHGYVHTPGSGGSGTSRPAPIYQPAPVMHAPGGSNEVPRSGSERQMPRYTAPAPTQPSGGSHTAPAPVSHPAPSGGGHVSAPSGGGGGHVSAPSGGGSSTPAPSSSHK